MNERMKALAVLLVILMTGAAAASESATETNYLIANGERFHQQKIVFPAKDAEAFLFLDAYHHGSLEATRMELRGSLDGRAVDFQLYVPIWTTGTTEIIAGENDAHNLKNWAFLHIDDGATYGDGLQGAKLKQMTVTLTKYGPVGGLIEGTFRGTLDTTVPSPYRHVDIAVEGKFAIKRGKDVKSF